MGAECIRIDSSSPAAKPGTSIVPTPGEPESDAMDLDRSWGRERRLELDGGPCSRGGEFGDDRYEDRAPRDFDSLRKEVLLLDWNNFLSGALGFPAGFSHAANLAGMLAVKGLRQRGGDRVALLGVARKHARPSDRLQQRPVHADGNHQYADQHPFGCASDHKNRSQKNHKTLRIQEKIRWNAFTGVELSSLEVRG